VKRKQQDDLIPAVGYGRMSSDAQALSPEQQRREVEEYAARNGYRIIRWYFDEGVSASRGQEGDELRVQYQQLLIDSNKRDFKAVLAWSHSRFTRNEALEAAHGKRILRNNGVRLVTVKEGVIDWTTDEGRIKDFLSSFVDHKYSVDLGRDSQRGRRNTFINGGYPYGQIPYGYNHLYLCGTQKREVRRGEQTKNLRGWIHSLAVVEEEAEVVRRIFRLFVEEDKSLAAIARQLNNEGVTGPDFAKKRKKTLIRSGVPLWTVQNVRQRMTTGAYVRISTIGGEPRQKRHAHNRIEREERLGDWPAIVDRAVYDRAQAKLAKHAGQAHEGRSGALQGILRCGHCGQVLHKENPRKKDDPRGDKYRCATKARGLPGECRRWTCYEAEIMPRVAAELVRVVDEEAMRMLEATPEQRGKIGTATVVEAHVEALEARIKDATADYVASRDKPAMRAALEDLIEKLGEEVKGAKQRLGTLQAAQAKGGVEKFVEWWQGARPSLVMIAEGHAGKLDGEDVLIEQEQEDGTWEPVGYFTYSGGREGAVFNSPRFIVEGAEDGTPPPRVVDGNKLRAMLKRLDVQVRVFWRRVTDEEREARRRGRGAGCPGRLPEWVIDEARMKVTPFDDCGDSGDGGTTTARKTAITLERVLRFPAA
jgi:DNA invertase Pin-like site-specific DNA recombinase